MQHRSSSPLRSKYLRSFLKSTMIFFFVCFVGIAYPFTQQKEWKWKLQMAKYIVCGLSSTHSSSMLHSTTFCSFATTTKNHLLAKGRGSWKSSLGVDLCINNVINKMNCQYLIMLMSKGKIKFTLLHPLRYTRGRSLNEEM